MKPYVDGFILNIKKDKIDTYKKMAELGCKIWMKHGAVAYYECEANDLEPQSPEFPTKHFNRLADAKEDEVVFFSFIIFKSKEHRDEVNKKAMEDPEMQDPGFDPSDMPFEMEQMAYGGFEALVFNDKNQ